MTDASSSSQSLSAVAESTTSDGSCHRGPPPEYSEVDPLQSNEQPRRRGYCQKVSRLLSPYVNRRPCYNPYSRNFPGCCTKCYWRSIMDFACMSLQILLCVIALGIMGRSYGWKHAPMISTMAFMTLMCIRTSTRTAEILSIIGRAGQATSLLFSAMMWTDKAWEMPGKSTAMNDVKATTSSKALRILSITAMALSVAMGALTTSYNFDCLWMAQECMWKALIVAAVLMTELGITLIMETTDENLKYVAVFCTITSALLAIRDYGTSFTNTCAFKAHRYWTMKTKAKLGRAIVGSRRSDERGVIIREDDTELYDVVKHFIVELTIIFLALGGIPVSFAIQRAGTRPINRQDYERVILTYLTAAMCGCLCGFAFGPERPPVERGARDGRRIAWWIYIMGLILTAVPILLGPILVTLACGMIVVGTIMLIRSKSAKKGRLLAASCLAKALICDLLITCVITIPVSKMVDIIYQ